MVSIDYQKVDKVTWEKLGKDGFCVWTCEKIGKIVILLDPHLFDGQMRFSDPLYLAAQYPRYTVDELRQLVSKSDAMIDRINEVKKIAPAQILIDED